jgi:hypothetical protein
MIIVPDAFSSRMTRSSCSLLAASRPDHGSSSKSTLGAWTSARASATRCCWHIAIGEALGADARPDPVPRGTRLDAVEPRGELDVLPRGQLAVAMRRVSYPTELRAHLLAVGPQGRVGNAPQGRPEHRPDHRQERAFARAVGAFQKRDRPRFECAGYPAERGRGAEQARDPTDFDTFDRFHPAPSIPRPLRACRGGFPPYFAAWGVRSKGRW